MNKYEKFQSKRLLYRGIEEKDAAHIVYWRNQGDNSKYYINPHKITIKNHMEWFEKYLLDDSRYDFCIIEKNTMCPIGVVGAKNIKKNESCEISYIIGDITQRGKGYAKESIITLLNRLTFEGIHTFEAVIHKNNSVSLYVAKACGFEVISIENNFILLRARYKI